MIDFGLGNVPQLNDTERQLLVKILNVLNAVGGGGGGGGTVGFVQGAYANYGGMAPTWTPTGTALGLAVDTSNGRPWYYFNGKWN